MFLDRWIAYRCTDDLYLRNIRYMDANVAAGDLDDAIRFATLRVAASGKLHRRLLRYPACVIRRCRHELQRREARAAKLAAGGAGVVAD